METDATHRIVELDSSGIDSVEHLWRAMVAHHAQVTEGTWPVREQDLAWRMRRAEYEKWLAEGTGWLLSAVPIGGGAPDGYAALTVHKPGATFDLGDPVGDLESLAVSPEARGTGVGTMLIDACRRKLGELGVRNWIVTAMDANDGALRLYEREGFRPFARVLVEPLSPGGD